MKARLFITLIILSVCAYLIFSLAAAGEAGKTREPERVKEVIDKALVQCYALEGSYPFDIDHLKNYGVVIDTDRYFYYFEAVAVNIKPMVTVIVK